MVIIQLEDTAGLGGDDFDAFLEIGDDAKSVSSDEFSDESLGSFHCPTPSSRQRFPVEILINFLSVNIAVDVDMARLEHLTNTVLAKSQDPELLKVVKLYGWSGTRYASTDAHPFEPPCLLQALSNLYLKQKNSNASVSYANLFGMGDTSGLEQMFAFCPDSLLDYLNNHPAPSTDHIATTAEEVRSISFFGACMLVDISGFSKFSGSMCSKGVSGLDELRKATNGFLGHFVETVYEYNGDVIAFAGDALVCVFKDTPDKDLANCSYRAIQCAAVLRTHKSKNLSTHIGISCGDMKMALLGGLNQQYVYLMNGACVSELSSCIEQAGTQEVVVTETCYLNAIIGKAAEDSGIMVETIENSRNLKIMTIEKTGSTKLFTLKSKKSSFVGANGERVSPSLRKKSFSLAKQNTSPTRRMSRSAPSNKSYVTTGSLEDIYSITNEDSAENSEKSLDKTQDYFDSIASFVPRPVLNAINSESLDLMGELREVTTLFLSLDSYSAEKHADPAALQPFFLMAQAVLLESGGYLRQFLVDDKGCVLIAMWGAPSFTYSNNCSRALFCAAALRERAEMLGHTVSIGVTTGIVFCGTIGATERKDYAGIGTDVNMASRLMAKAKGRILLDQATFSHLNEETKELLVVAEEMMMKGSAEPVTPYEYFSQNVPLISALDEHAPNNHSSSNSGMNKNAPTHNRILKKRIMSLINKQLDKISNNASLSPNQWAERQHNSHLKVWFTVVLGSPGTGKSIAAEYFRHTARKRNIQSFYIHAYPGLKHDAYGLIREVIIEIMGVERFSTDHKQFTAIDEVVERAFVNDTEEEKNKARLALESVLGVSRLSHFNRYHSSSFSEGNSNSESEDYSSGGNSGYSGKEGGGNGIAPGGEMSSVAALNNFRLSRNSSRPVGDQTICKIIASLLHSEPTALIIEDAHFCDELSWKELLVLINATDMNLSVLITMKSNMLPPKESSRDNEAKMMREGSNVSSLSSMESVSSQTNTTNTAKSLLATDNDDVAVAHSSTNKKALLDRLRITPLNMTYVGNRSSSTIGDYSDTNTDNLTRDCEEVTSKPPDACLSLIYHTHSLIIEMAELKEDEVRAILLHTLEPHQVTADLVSFVLDLSSGNAFWCKSIASYVKEKGVASLEKSRQKFTKQGSLKVLILLRMEKLSLEQQLILKYAAIVGDQFDEKMLSTILPKQSPASSQKPSTRAATLSKNKSVAVQSVTEKLENLGFSSKSTASNGSHMSTTVNGNAGNNNGSNRPMSKALSISPSNRSRFAGSLSETLELLAELGFIYCIKEYPQMIYGFQNHLTQSVLYDLMPPSDAALVHLSVAEYLETEFASNLRPYYASLGYHYKNSTPDKRYVAFKYELKSADRAISRGAYSDGITFALSSCHLGLTTPELELLRDVIDRAINDMKVLQNTQKQSQNSGKGHKKQASFGSKMNLLKATLAAANIVSNPSTNNMKHQNSNNINNNNGNNTSNGKEHEDENTGIESNMLSQYTDLKAQVELKLECRKSMKQQTHNTSIHLNNSKNDTDNIIHNHNTCAENTAANAATTNTPVTAHNTTTTTTSTLNNNNVNISSNNKVDTLQPALPAESFDPLTYDDENWDTNPEDITTRPTLTWAPSYLSNGSRMNTMHSLNYNGDYETQNNTQNNSSSHNNNGSKGCCVMC